MKRYFSLLLFILGATLSGNAQGEIIAKVVDAETDKPLAYASVRFDDSNEGVLSDENGMFIIDSSVHIVEISYVGYSTNKITAISLKEKIIISLQPIDNVIEEVLVGTPNAEEILRIADSLSFENHFAENTAQPGFYTERLVSNNEFLKISEASFDRHMHREDGNSRTRVHVLKARSAIDSNQLTDVNRIFNFKKEQIDFDVNSFIEMGQAVSFNQETSESNKRDRSVSVKFDTESKFNGYQEYLGREAFDITYTVHKGKTLIADGRYLIDTDTYAYLAFEMDMNEQANLNKMIPFVARAFFTLMGYSFKIRELNYKVYTRPVGDTFYMDKAAVLSGVSIARGKEWVHGRIIQEYIMGSPTEVLANKEYKKFDDEVSTYNFDKEFWQGRYHINTANSKQKIVSQIKENNLGFEGEIGSPRYLKWKAKQERRGK